VTSAHSEIRATPIRPTPASIRGPFPATLIPLFLRRWSFPRYFLLIAIAMLTFLPLSLMVLTSLKTLPEVFAEPPSILPARLQWHNYVEALTAFPFFRYLLNTLLITTGRVLGVVASSALVAWGFARFKSNLNGPLFLICLATLMLPPQVTAIPVFVMFLKAGMYNTYGPLIIPSWLATNAFFIFLLKQFFEAIPEDLLNAARIDGCGELGIFWSIGLPLCRPILWTVAIFTILWSWNDYFSPLIYLSDEKLYPLSLGLTYFMTASRNASFGTQWNLLMAVSTLTMIPVALLFFVAQRAFIETASSAGIKQ
jgi:multiple sugar transport system permease protein